VIRRRYGAIERSGKAIFAFNSYCSLLAGADQAQSEDTTVTLFHVVERRSKPTSASLARERARA
jgi:hypothetical protein